MNEMEMMKEWEAWQRVVETLKTCACAIDINVEDRLAAAIELWGETLVCLRVVQTPEIRAQAYDDKILHYNAALTH